MKKISLFIVSVLFLIPLSVAAADNPSVKTLEASAKGSTISYNGTMEEGSHAVMCKLFDKDSNELDLLSSAVDSSKFEGSFEVSAEGEYTVYCANYEGGETKNVTDKVEKVDKSTVKNAKTCDNIMKFVVLSIVSLIGLGFVVIRLKKQMN